MRYPHEHIIHLRKLGHTIAQDKYVVWKLSTSTLSVIQCEFCGKIFTIDGGFSGWYYLNNEKCDLYYLRYPRIWFKYKDLTCSECIIEDLIK